VLHITNGESTRASLEPSGVPGRFSSWDDVLHDGPTALMTGEEWLRLRARYFASVGYGTEEEMARAFRGKDDVLEQSAGEDEIVFWFEHDLYDQLLLVRHLWWIGRRAADTTSARRTAFSIVLGHDYLGLLKPQDFPPRFARRRPITAEQIRIGTAVWEAFCSGDPGRLVPFAAAHGGGPAAEYADASDPLPYLGRALRRLLEEFPAVDTGLSRSERQILDVLAEGARTPEQTFVAASRREDDIWMGDWSFWTICRRLGAGAHPLLTIDVTERPGRLPAGTLDITATGRRVRARQADHVALNAPSRWIGGTVLSPERSWRWTGSSLLPPAP
jgi:hypothetical protein